MSFVLMSPSMVMRLNDCSTETLSAFCSTSFSITASVVRKQSIVAMFGSIMPAPLAMPPMRTCCPPISNSTAISLGKVSLVMIARATAALPSAESAAGKFCAIVPSIFSIGSGTPMRPVEQTSTCRSFSPSALAVGTRHALCRLDAGESPVQALALPAFATIARTSALRRCIRETRTGAAFTRFVVKVPAATVGVGEWISAMSGRSGLLALMPQ